MKKMDSRTALKMAILLFEKEPQTEENIQAKQCLEKLSRRDLVAKWTKRRICNTLDQWTKEHGHPPTVSNLREPGMPSPAVIQKHFEMGASAFLNSRYPGDKKDNQYGFNGPDDWLDCFRTQFVKHMHEDGFSSNTYNQLKDPGTPVWTTIAARCGTTRWTKLMEMAEVKYPNKTEVRKSEKPMCIGKISSPFLDRLEADLKERERLDTILITAIDRASQKDKEFMNTLDLCPTRIALH
ncbi:MAG: hypothetical protein LIO76_10275 [Clostridiales bacterium]|nr:hypothetical protein [Clostridiales bacterium]